MEEKKKTNRLSSSKMLHEKKLKAKIQQDTTQTKFLPDTDTQSLFGGEVADLANSVTDSRVCSSPSTMLARRVLPFVVPSIVVALVVLPRLTVSQMGLRLYRALTQQTVISRMAVMCHQS